MRKRFKKLIIIWIAILSLWVIYCPTIWVYHPSEAVDFPYNNTRTWRNIDECRDLWNCTNLSDKIDITDQHSIINRLLSVFWLDSNTFNWDHKFIYYAKAILNLALWLLSMIALVMTIYTFYMMFFTENEAWIKKAKWNLIGIFIALAIIWLSWLIVSFIFRWYQSNWQTSLPQRDATISRRI